MVTPSNKRVQQPGNVTQVVDEYIGPPRQIIVDTQRNELRLHDGKRKGGWSFPNLTTLKRLFVSSDSEIGQIKFAGELRGFMTRVADRTYRLRTITAGDGIVVSDGTGEAGNPTSRVANRLASVHSNLLIDVNSAVESGTYIAGKTANAMPPALAGVANAVVTVTAGKDEEGDLFILQQAISLTTTADIVYTRRQIAGTWSAWA